MKNKFLHIILFLLSLPLLIISWHLPKDEKTMLNSYFKSKQKKDNLEFVKVFVIKRESLTASTPPGDFGLSGLAGKDGNVYAVFDNLDGESQRVYTIDTAGVIHKADGFNKVNGSDLEGIDTDAEGNLYIVSEETNNLFIQNKDRWEEKPLDFRKVCSGNWGNSGLEGIAVDPDNNKIIYFAKEKKAENTSTSCKELYSRYIIRVDLAEKNSNPVVFWTSSADDSSSDFTDLKIEKKNGKKYLYILERLKDQITKLDITDTDLKKAKVVDSLSFASFTRKGNEQNLYRGNPKFGLAEALLLTENEIWIGLDNNGEKAKADALVRAGVNTNPIVLIFKRPQGF